MCRAEGLEEARGGGTVSAPQRDDAIHSWDEGVRTNVYRSVSPSISLSLSTNLHDYYLLPSPLCISGNRARNGNLIPASFHSIARTSIEWLDIDRVGDISVKRDQGKTAIRPSFIVGSSVRLTCREIVRYIYRIKLILYVIFYIEDKNTSCTNFNLFVRTNLIVTLVCWKK